MTLLLPSRCDAPRRWRPARMHEGMVRRIVHAGADIDRGEGRLLQADGDPVALGEGELTLAIERDGAGGNGRPERRSRREAPPAEDADIAQIARRDGRV